jgi:hypothetical protein
MNGYRLSGTDMTSWSGQRVQIVGVVVPAAAGSPTATGATLPEFRVTSVTPASGASGGCPQR